MPENCTGNDCPMLPRIEALERDSEHNKDAHKEFYGKLESSRTSVAVIDERMSQIKADTEEIKASVRELKEKPAKRWESLLRYVLSALVGAFMAWLAAGMPGAK